MKKLTVILIALFCSVVAFSQFGGMQLQDPQSGRVYKPSRYSDINGTPFLTEKWQLGNVVTSKGIYKGLNLRLDAYSHVLYFNKNEEAYEFEEPVLRFMFTPNPADSSNYVQFVKGLTGADVRKDQYLMILSEGKLPLYKVPMIFVSEVNEINKGVVKTFRKVDKYYTLKDNSLQLLKLSKSDVLEILSDKKDKVEAFVKTQDLSFKKDADVVAIFKYYNSLN
jgi:hypothetical protein